MRQKQEVCILPPNPGKVTRHKLSPQGLSAKVLGILQRLMLTGDLEEADETVEHQPVAGAGEDCICLAVTDAPLRFKSRFMRLVQPILGI